jgi:hypothetical protein
MAALKARSPLRASVQNLASSVHQDFPLMGIGPEEWGKEFLKSHSTDQKRVLKAELLVLTAANPGKNGKGLRNSWTRLGAASGPRSSDLRQTIDSWIRALE